MQLTRACSACTLKYLATVRIVAPKSQAERRAGDDCLGRERADQDCEAVHHDFNAWNWEAPPSK